MKLWGEFHNFLNKIIAKNTCKGNSNDNVKILIKIMILLSKSAWTAGDFPANVGCNRAHPCGYIV